MPFLNQTVFDIPLTWNRTRFKTMHNKCRIARKLIENSINVQFEKQMRKGFAQNIEIEANINDIDERLPKYQDKLRLLDNMIELASQSLRTYFDKRMQYVRTIVKEHCNIIEQIISEEAEHWKEIHTVMNQNLLNPGDIRPCNNSYPRIVQKSPAANIQTIQEENDDNAGYLSKSVPKPVTPSITQIIPRSNSQSKRFTEVPSIKIQSPDIQEIGVCRKDERFSVNMLPRNTVRQPFEIIGATFVVKPEDTIIDGEIQHDDYDNEANGTYRAANQQYNAHLTIAQPNTLLTDSQPNIPARLCFSPTILQDASVSHEDNSDEQVASSYTKKNQMPINIIFPSYEQSRMCFRNFTTDNHRFGQTVLLDVLKTEQVTNDEKRFHRPIIQEDNDVIIVAEIPPPVIARVEHPIQQEPTTVQEKLPIKSRRRRTTKTKSKPIVVSTRKTRSAAKIQAEREVAAAKALLEKSMEQNRKSRKRKQSKSIDRLVDSSDNENRHKRRTKMFKKLRIDHHEYETSDDENDEIPVKSKLKTRKRHRRHHEAPNDNKDHKRKTKRLKENDVTSHPSNIIKDSMERKKVKLSIIDNENIKPRGRKPRQKLKNIENNDQQSKKRRTTRPSIKRSNRLI